MGMILKDGDGNPVFWPDTPELISLPEKRLVEVENALDSLSAMFDFSDEKWDFEIVGFKLQRTSIACPEQYDVFDQSGEVCGYLRLRHGYFRADYPECGGETVYSASTDGDGMFSGDDERMYHLTKAVEAIQHKTMKA